ncbi:MAG: hypothetical protein Q9186_006184 [Xanthomendoza sp. 1 TL-2023]
MDSFLLPQRLATITSLELVWDLLNQASTEKEHESSSGRHWSLYNALMRKISHNFPSTTNLHISVEATTYIANPAIINVEKIQNQLFAPADAVARSLGSQLRAFEIAPNLSLFNELARRAKKEGAREERGPTYLSQRFWRSASMSSSERIRLTRAHDVQPVSVGVDHWRILSVCEELLISNPQWKVQKKPFRHHDSTYCEPLDGTRGTRNQRTPQCQNVKDSVEVAARLSPEKMTEVYQLRHVAAAQTLRAAEYFPTGGGDHSKRNGDPKMTFIVLYPSYVGAIGAAIPGNGQRTTIPLNLHGSTAPFNLYWSARIIQGALKLYNPPWPMKNPTLPNNLGSPKSSKAKNPLEKKRRL